MRQLLPALALAVACALVRGANLAAVLPTVVARLVEGGLFVAFVMALVLIVPWKGSRQALPGALLVGLALLPLQRVLSWRGVGSGMFVSGVTPDFGPVTTWPALAFDWPQLGIVGALSIGRAVLLALTAILVAMAWRRARASAVGAGLAGGLFVSACASCAAPALALVGATMPASGVMATLVDLGVPMVAAAALVSPMSVPRMAFAVGASDAAEHISGLFAVFNVVAFTVTGAFLVLLIFAIVRGARRTEPTAGAALRTRRRLGWAFAVGLLGLFAAMAALSLGVQHSMEASASAQAMHVKVTGMQWGWAFEYPNGTTSLNTLSVPVGREIAFDVTSRDVVHSFFVPDLGLQVNAVPGRVNTGHLTVLRAGEWDGRCAEYCGIGHTQMTLHVVAT